MDRERRAVPRARHARSARSAGRVDPILSLPRLNLAARPFPPFAAAAAARDLLEEAGRRLGRRGGQPEHYRRRRRPVEILARGG